MTKNLICSESSQIKFTYGGIVELAEILRTARGDRSLRQFQRETSVPQAILHMIDLWRTDPSDNLRMKHLRFATLEKLAPFTAYSAQELKDICEGNTLTIKVVRDIDL